MDKKIKAIIFNKEKSETYKKYSDLYIELLASYQFSKCLMLLGISSFIICGYYLYSAYANPNPEYLYQTIIWNHQFSLAWYHIIGILMIISISFMRTISIVIVIYKSAINLYIAETMQIITQSGDDDHEFIRMLELQFDGIKRKITNQIKSDIS